MRPSQACVDLVKQFESLRLIAYPAPESTPEKTVWAIGYGHTAPTVREGDTCTVAQAEAYLIGDLNSACDRIAALITYTPLTQGQFDALVSFAYNTKWQAFKDSTLLRKVNAGDMEGAAAEFDRWVHSAGRVLDGLVRRRAAEKALFLGGSNAT